MVTNPPKISSGNAHGNLPASKMVFPSHRHDHTSTIASPDPQLYREELFRSLLIIERKRAERSKRSCILMLIDISALRKHSGGLKAIGRLSRTILVSTRESDIKGWYTSDRVLGIVFTDSIMVNESIFVNKTDTILQRALTPQQRSLVVTARFHLPLNACDRDYERYGVKAVIYERKPECRRSECLAVFSKRTIDIVAGLSLLFLFAPVFLIVPIIIKLTSKGPVFFRQDRLGIYGKKFKVLKFRTMHQDNDSEIHQKFMREFIRNSGATQQSGETKPYKMTDDPRITGIGKFLRKTSLDELPQFFNVLIGDMSMVGPRPAIPYEVDEYDIWHKRRVFEVKPGITGIWQIRGRSRTDFDNMVRMDIRYIKEWSPLLDILLILKTPFALLSTKGAY